MPMCIRRASTLEKYNKRRSIDLDAQLAIILLVALKSCCREPYKFDGFSVRNFLQTFGRFSRKTPKRRPLNAHAEIIFISRA